MLDLLTQPPPIIRLQLGILDTLLAPILMCTTDMVLTLLEVDKFVSDAFFDEDAAGVLVDNGLFVLRFVSLAWDVIEQPPSFPPALPK